MAWRGRRQPPCSDPKLYENYYSNQVGNGLPVFMGTRAQRGHGLGNIFASLTKAAMPLIKTSVKALGKHGLKTGVEIVGDVLSGKKPKRAVQRRATQLLGRALHEFSPPGEPAQPKKGIKRRAPKQTRSSSKSKRQRDIFS